MNTTHKIIKGCAIALAIFIIIAIISAVISILSSFFALNWGIQLIDGVIDIATNDTISQTYTFNVDEVTALSVDCGVSDLKITTGDELKVVAKNVVDTYTCEVVNGVLEINTNSSAAITINDSSSITLYIPNNYVFEDVTLNLSVGDTDIYKLLANTFVLNCGAGDIDINYIEVNDNATISCGAGELDINNSKISNLTLEAGLGEIDLVSKFKGNCNMTLGAGEANIKLVEFNESTDSITIEKGIGTLEINNVKYSTNQSLGIGNDTNIYINCGIGELDIEY